MSIEVINCGDFSLEGDQVKQEVHQAPRERKKQDSDLVKREMMKTIKHDEKGDIKQHQEYVLMLSRYGTSPRFGDYLKKLSFELTVPKLKKQTVRELEELLERVRTSVANKTVSDLWTDTIMSGVNMVETACTMTKLGNSIRLNGITEVLKEDESFLDLLEELKLNNQNLAYTSPYTRLAYTLLTVAFHVHSVNTMMEKRNKKVKEPTLKQPPKAEKIEDEKVKDEMDQPKVISTKPKRVDPADRVFSID